MVGSVLRMWDFLGKMVDNWAGGENGKVDDEGELEADEDEVDTG